MEKCRTWFKTSLLFLPRRFVDFSDVAARFPKSDTFVMTSNFINYSEQAGVENRGCFFLNYKYNAVPHRTEVGY